MITESEAKTKWCPLVGQTRFTHQGEECIGSQCMAWRFDEQQYEDGEPLPLGSIPADSGWEKNGETWYCGPGVTGEKRQCWRKPLPRTGSCGAFKGRSR